MDIPFATVADIGRGKIYLPSESVWIPKVEKPEAPTIEQEMTNDRRWFSPPLYGWPRFADIFTSRQLTAMVTLSDLVKGIRQDVIEDARKAGVSDAEADDYAKTITTFLALALDRCAGFNNGLCIWAAGNQKVMNLFSRQAIPMVWDFAEANILGDTVGSWITCGNYVADCIEVLGKSAGGGGNGR